MASGSRWGSFLQQAVAGVESRLDTILGETEEVAQESNLGASSGTTTPTSKRVDTSSRKTAHSQTTNDRLQERLARAVAAKSHAATSANNQVSRLGSPNTASSSPRGSLEQSARSSLDIGRTTSESVATAQATRTPANLAATSSLDNEQPAAPRTNTAREETTAHVDLMLANQELERNITQHESDADDGGRRSNTPSDEQQSPNAPLPGIADASSIPSSSNRDHSDVERQQEIHGYIERIDALQAKLQYLSREAVESARKATAAAASGSLEKRLAEKDERIALLIEEGQKLSHTELKHMTVIKRLRSAMSAKESEAFEARKRAEKLEKDKNVLAERLSRVEAAEKQSGEHQKALTQTQKELAAVLADRDVKISMITQLREQLQDAALQTKAEDLRIMQDRLDVERDKISALESELSSTKVESELSTSRLKVQFDEFRAKAERELERARLTELELKAEQQTLEGRLELLRTRAEEVSSGATGDAQAKLLRQIETLQSQYAVASENWQRIEASLTSKATTLEREKDEAINREAETRRKAREMGLKSKRTDEQIEELRAKTSNLSRELREQSQALVKLQGRAEAAEAALVTARANYEQDRQALSAELEHRVDDERAKSKSVSHTGSGIESPAASVHRGLTVEHLSLQNLQARRTSTRSVTNDAISDRLLSRRSSAIHGIRPASGKDASTPPIGSFPQQSQNRQSDGVETSSVNNLDTEDYFDNITTPMSPQDKINDMVSMSTVNAGPSVQLVERMSAAVRRLETEKVSTKEEMERLSAQRDEARAEILSLMHEVEAKRLLDARVSELERENAEIHARYQTTLEMLGEKSELVEELRADVQDVKDMYRELVERTIK